MEKVITKFKCRNLNMNLRVRLNSLLLPMPSLVLPFLPKKL